MSRICASLARLRASLIGLRAARIAASATLGLSLWATPALLSDAVSAARAEPAAPRVGHSGYPIPRYVSVKANEARLRRGPGTDYPILWVLTRRGLPVRIIGEYDHWRRVELHNGERGWMHKALLSGRRTAIMLGATRELHAQPLEQAARVARIGEATPLRLNRCEAEWCEAQGKGVRGWAPKSRLWGVGLDEEFD
ncbi:MAG: SH3 domain-containing protein [Pseudomonadota bacterium]